MFKSFRPPPSWGYTLLEFDGKDAQDFLQRITTLQVQNLEELVSYPTYILSPQGKVVSAFSLFTSNGKFYLQFEAGIQSIWLKHLTDRIEFYHFGEDIVLKPLSHLYQATFVLGNETHDFSSDAEWVVKSPRSKLHSFKYSTIWTRSESQIETTLSENDWEFQRIIHLEPRLGYEINENVIPLELGDDETVFSPKGCFPGQEVIEKIISIGSPPRKLALLTGSQPAKLPLGTELISTTGEKCGTVTSSATYNNKTYSLALIKKAFAQMGSRFLIQDNEFVLEKIRGTS